MKDTYENNETIYGKYLPNMEKILESLEKKLESENNIILAETGENGYEHLSGRIKADQSMREKLAGKGFSIDSYSALRNVYDAIGLRIVCSFRDDVYKMADKIRGFENTEVVQIKDYIKKEKPNGYRSYHMIIKIETPFEDVDGKRPGEYFVEIQLRTIAMDTWAALEHKMRYKKNVPNQKILGSELKRCADELASCDLSMQTIRDLINSENN